MKNIISTLLVTMMMFSSSAQEKISWQVKHDKKLIFQANEENAEKNNLTVSATDFKSKSCFTVNYLIDGRPEQKTKWIRTITIYDDKDNELLKKQASKLIIKDHELKKLLKENKTIHIYTWSLPKDPKEAARIRIRRVHLCTIVLG